MRRVWIAALTAGGLLLAAALVALVVAHRELAPQRLAARLAGELSAATGRVVTVRGPVELTLGHRLHFVVHDVEVASLPGDPVPLAVLGRLEGSLDASALWDRRLEFGPLVVAGLALHLVTDAAGHANWQGLGAASGAGAAAWSWSVASLTLQGASVTLADARSGGATRVVGLGVETGPLARSAPVDVRASADLDSAALPSAHVAVATRVALEAGATRATGLTLELSVPHGGARLPVHVALARTDYRDGSASLQGIEVRALGLVLTAPALEARADAAGWTAAGRVVVAPFAPRALAAALGLELPPMRGPGALETAALAADVRASAAAADLTGLVAELDGAHITGRARLVRGGAAELDLDVDRLEADRYLKPARPHVREPVVVPVEWLRATQARGRVRIGRLSVAGTTLRQVTLQLDGEHGGGAAP